MTDRDRGDQRESIEGNPARTEESWSAPGAGHEDEHQGSGETVREESSRAGGGAGRSDPENEENEK